MTFRLSPADLEVQSPYPVSEESLMSEFEVFYRILKVVLWHKREVMWNFRHRFVLFFGVMSP